MMLTRKELKTKLRYLGTQYTSDNKHLLIQSVDRIEEVEKALSDLLNACIDFTEHNQITKSALEKASEVLKDN